MDRSGIGAVRHASEQRLRAAEPKKATVRSVGILLIAAIQFLKAAVLLLAGFLLQAKPEMISGPSSPLYPLLYVATRGRYDSMNAELQGGGALAGLLLFLGVYLAVIAFGMFYVNPWARRTLIFSCGLTLAFFTKSTLWPDPEAAVSPNMTNFYILLAVDAWVFLYLLRSNTAALFSKKR